MRELLAHIREWFTTERCQGCPGRVRRIGGVWGLRRESAYCKACLSLMGIEEAKRG